MKVISKEEFLEDLTAFSKQYKHHPEFSFMKKVLRELSYNGPFVKMNAKISGKWSIMYVDGNPNYISLLPNHFRLIVSEDVHYEMFVDGKPRFKEEYIDSLGKFFTSMVTYDL